MTRAFALGLLLLSPALAVGKPRPAKDGKKVAAAAAPRAPVVQATDDEAPGSRQEADPKKKKK